MKHRRCRADIGVNNLEIKRTSITRLKRNPLASLVSGFSGSLKSKEPRLRDWNPFLATPAQFPVLPWNQKNLDYEIETWSDCNADTKYSTWNQKNLDYEIETIAKRNISRGWKTLEIKRTSITRLKQFSVTTCTCWRHTWNQKNLDYEIETDRIEVVECHKVLFLKSKEPRLRDWNGFKSCASSMSASSWNQKNLDYEIETSIRHACRNQRW